MSSYDDAFGAGRDDAPPTRRIPRVRSEDMTISLPTFGRRRPPRGLDDEQEQLLAKLCSRGPTRPPRRSNAASENGAAADTTADASTTATTVFSAAANPAAAGQPRSAIGAVDSMSDTVKFAPLGGRRASRQASGGIDRPIDRPPDRPAAGTARGARRRRHSVRSMILRVVLTAGCFTLALAASAAAVVGYTYHKYNSQIRRVAVLQTHDPNIREASRQQHAENFLIIGSDSRAGADASYGNVAGARSDTTIVVHLSPDHEKATVISIPRDSWVSIPACKTAGGSVQAAHSDMFNSAFAIGGPRCTIATVQKLTGIAITHFVEIDFSGFKNMVKALGSVTICSPQDVFDSSSGLRLHVGNNKLNGTEALAYVRARESLGDGSDLGRIKRQQMFLGAVLRQALDGSMLSNLGRLTSFLDAATKAIVVDKGTTFGDLRTLATSMRGLDPSKVHFYTAPIANVNYTPPGTDMSGRVLLDTTKGRVLYDSVINDRKPVTVKTVNGKSTIVPSKKKTTHAKPNPAAPKANFNAGQKTCSL